MKLLIILMIGLSSSIVFGQGRSDYDDSSNPCWKLERQILSYILVEFDPSDEAPEEGEGQLYHLSKEFKDRSCSEKLSVTAEEIVKQGHQLYEKVVNGELSTMLEAEAGATSKNIAQAIAEPMAESIVEVTKDIVTTMVNAIFESLSNESSDQFSNNRYYKCRVDNDEANFHEVNDDEVAEEINQTIECSEVSQEDYRKSNR